MHDRAVRRRRAALAALVVLSLGLLTVYFGESAGGALHSAQRGVTGVLSPIQEGASRALKPARDLFGWFGDTLDAKSERDRLKAERDALRQEVAELEVQRRDNEQLRELLEFNTGVGIDRYQPVKARVITRSPSLWYSTFQINQGSSEGLRAGQPVVNGEGLVGKVKSVSSSSAWVTLITDREFGVSAQAARTGEPGIIEPAVGAPGTLLFELVPQGRLVRRSDRIVTAGTTSEELPSLFPRGIPIGTVERIVEGDGQLDRRIHVMPAVDLRRVEFVEVLTRATGDLRASTAP
ncbi:MAG: Rod shape-determining protein MreC [uncultured Solirubrobacteraceae bacterium]|uniref:Cell shape-determining protein MreC n=1 Tax=uncultured Solirubrobacteraceae bacterium TaxID=1162706 RepID=A0A6J4RHL0_9ACTN|nr:MAG: Rod shape-determining protein MreC [uncultured Solirubrobacteraceae bacterium]